METKNIILGLVGGAFLGYISYLFLNKKNVRVLDKIGDSDDELTDYIDEVVSNEELGANTNEELHELGSQVGLDDFPLIDWNPPQSVGNNNVSIDNLQSLNIAREELRSKSNFSGEFDDLDLDL